MSDFWRPIKLKAAYAARALQMQARQDFARVQRDFPNVPDLHRKWHDIIQESESLASECDLDVFTPEQLANFDL
jgi:predicted ester cyclase